MDEDRSEHTGSHRRVTPDELVRPTYAPEGRSNGQHIERYVDPYSETYVGPPPRRPPLYGHPGLPPRDSERAGERTGERVRVRDRERTGEFGGRSADQGRGQEPTGPLSYLSTAISTLGWYTLPAMAYLVWAYMLDSAPRAGCVSAAGVVCRSPRDEAVADLVTSLPLVAIALALSVVLAVVLRWTTTGWRSLTIGFAGAVIGAGATSIMLTVINS